MSHTANIQVQFTCREACVHKSSPPTAFTRAHHRQGLAQHLWILCWHQAGSGGGTFPLTYRAFQSVEKKHPLSQPFQRRELGQWGQMSIHLVGECEVEARLQPRPRDENLTDGVLGSSVCGNVGPVSLGAMVTMSLASG